MSVTAGGQEVHRAESVNEVAAGANEEDYHQLQADEDREIVAVSMSDTGGAGSVVSEISKSSQMELAETNHTDPSRGSTIAFGQGETFIEFDEGNRITWDAGEELHLHVRSGSASSEDVFILVYYVEV